MGRAKRKHTSSQKASPDLFMQQLLSGYWGGYGGTAGRNEDLIRSESGAALAYKIVSTCNRCIEIIANAVNNIPWEIVQGEGDNEKIIAASTDRVPKHPFALAMQGVYQEQSIPLRKLMVYSTLIYGEVFIERKPVLIGYARGLKWLNPLWTRPEIIQGYIQYFRYSSPYGPYVNIDPDDMAYIHEFNPHNDLLGWSKTMTVIDEINIDRDLKRDLKAFFRNGSRPGFVISPKGDRRYSPADVATIKEQVRNYLTGVDNGHSTLVSPIEATYEAFEREDVDKQYKVSTDIRTEIYMGYGVPPSMAGDSGGATYKDGEEVLEAFYFNTINPYAEGQAEFINTFLMPFFDPSGNTVFRVKVPQPRSVVINKTAETTLVDMQVKGMYLSYADGARAMGLTPAPFLENMYNINNVPVPADQIPTYWERVIPSAQPTAPVFGQSVQPQIGTPPTPQLPTGMNSLRTRKSGESGNYCILAPLPHEPAIKAIQDVVRGLIKGDVLEWQDPATFHLTLCYASGTIEQTDSVSLDGDLQTLIVDGVDSFDTPEGYAVHLKIRPSLDITTYQSRLVDSMRNAGMEVSTYSDVWQPHITLCYASEPFTPFSITPIVITAHGVEVSDDNREIVARGALKTHSHEHGGYEFESPMPVEEWRSKALKELAAWQKHIKAGKTRPFDPVYTRHILEEWSSRALDNGTSEAYFDYAFAAVRYEPFKATLSRLETAFARKDFGETKSEFEDEFLIAIADAKDGAISKSQLSAALNAVIDTLGPQAYLDALEDSGVANTEIDEEDQSTIDRLISEAKGYLNDFIASFDSKTQLQLDRTPRLWSSQTLQRFYQSGLQSADANGVYVWRLGPTIENCQTCLTLNGTRMRMKNWVKNGYLPQSLGTKPLDCLGYNCLCKLEPVRGR